MASLNAATSASQQLSSHRDQPWLLPSNRKLRNLVSLSLRNLSLDARHSGRTRGKTFDDDAVPQTLKSPAKIVAQREFRALEHSRSSEDLKSLSSPKEDDEFSPAEKVQRNGTPPRPQMRRMRRRSTLEWANATPQRRQEKLERVTEERLMDVFFTLHVRGLEEPIYISETVKKAMNPTFRHIDLSACSPGVTRLDHVVVRVWVKKSMAESQWKLLLDLETALHRLQYLGKGFDQLTTPLPQNAVILHLTDGIYTTFTNFISLPPMRSAPAARTNSSRVLPTSSFDALLRLSKLDDSIQDALTIRNRIASELENIFEANRVALTKQDQVSEAQDRLKTIEYAQKTVEKQLEKARKQAAEKRDLLIVRRNLIRSDLSTRDQTSQQMHHSAAEVSQSKDDRGIKRRANTAQRRRVCEDVQTIYPIQPIAGQSLTFTIRNLHLPNSDDLEAESPDTVAAALGHVAHVLLLLSFYLDHPLPYPVTVRGSTSLISDPISLLKSTSKASAAPEDPKQRRYPLFSRGVPRFRFEYAVFLLNKDVQLLLESGFGVRVLDLRHTLPNLKYLLYVATAGEGELPARKAGGVRGLSSAMGSRRGSERSVGSSTLVGSVGGGEGKAAVGSLMRTLGGGGRKGSGLR